jgi:bisphosphoglycerate-dependent phosphoglycerate mutase
MKDFVVPTKPDKKDGIMKELEWRRQWKLYNDHYASIQADHKVRLLLKWFKEDFFQWVNSPNCSICKVSTVLDFSDGRGKQSMQEWVPRILRNVVTRLEMWNSTDAQNVVGWNVSRDTTIQSNSFRPDGAVVENLQM